MDQANPPPYPKRADAATTVNLQDSCPCCGDAVRLGFVCGCGDPLERDEDGISYKVLYRNGVLWLQCPTCGQQGLPICVAKPSFEVRSRLSKRKRHVQADRPPKEPPSEIPQAFLR